MLRRFATLILIFALLPACAPKTARFLSEPSGAQVFIDGQPIGHTPCDYSYPLGFGGAYEVTVAKTGYEPVNQILRTDETDLSARNRWLAAGVIWSPLWLGTFFTKKLKDGYEFVLRQEAPQLTAQAESGSRHVQR